MERSTSPFIVVVGVCASGKTTLVDGLCARGYRARSVAQEHSAVPRLWTFHAPDFLVVLDCGLATIRKRRRVPWGEERLQAQRRRLSHARRHCQLYLCTDDLSVEEMIDCVLSALEKYQNEGNWRSEDDYPPNLPLVDKP
jgi:guanylate kinase